MSRNLSMTQEQVNEHLRKFEGDHRVAVPAADVESHNPATGQRPDEAHEVHSRFRIHVHHRSGRLSDAGGRSYKAAVDGLVAGGLLGDDKPEWVEAINESYEKAAEEETILTVVEIKEV